MTTPRSLRDGLRGMRAKAVGAGLFLRCAKVPGSAVDGLDKE